MSVKPIPKDIRQYNENGDMHPLWLDYYLSVRNTTADVAPSSATYITRTPNTDLTNEQALSTLATGFMKVTTSTGTISSTGNSTIQASDLANTAVTAGSYTVNGAASYTVDAQGRITAAASPVITFTGTANTITITGGTGTTPTATIASTYVGQTSITTLGTIATGVWNGTDIAYANIAQGTALSVLGVTGNAAADLASIVAGSDKQVLRRSGTSVGFGAIDLASSAAVSGNLAVTNLNSGTSASSSTFWRGDGTWSAPSGSGTVNSGTAGHLAYYATSTTAVSEFITPSASAYSSGATTFATATNTKVTFGTERWDVGNYFASSRYTPGVAGIYNVNAAVQLNNGIATSNYGISVYKNGTSYKVGAQYNEVATNANAIYNISCLVEMNGSTDYIEIFFLNGNATFTATNYTGGAEYNYFDVHWVGPLS